MAILLSIGAIRTAHGQTANPLIELYPKFEGGGFHGVDLASGNFRFREELIGFGSLEDLRK